MAVVADLDVREQGARLLRRWTLSPLTDPCPKHFQGIYATWEECHSFPRAAEAFPLQKNELLDSSVLDYHV